jgi:hypothetical protein
MKMDTLRMIVGFSIIGSHIASYAILNIWGEVALTNTERLDIGLLLGPIFAVYVSAIVRSIAANMHSSYDTAPLHIAFTVLAVFAAGIFALAVPLTIWMFIKGSIRTYGDLKVTLGAIETALGVYTGAIVDALFGHKGQRASAGGRLRR